MQCTATSKRSGQPCRRWAVKGRSTCPMHGGSTPRGMAHHGITHGRYSKHLPTRLLATYEQSQRDPNLLALMEEVAVVDARLGDLLKRVDTGESGQTWREARAALVAFEEANLRRDLDDARVAMDRLKSLINRGLSDEAAWTDVRVTLEQRRKLVESERKRLIDMQQMVTAEQAMVLITRLYDAVTRHVRDPDTLAAVGAELEVLASGSDPPTDFQA